MWASYDGGRAGASVLIKLMGAKNGICIGIVGLCENIASGGGNICMGIYGGHGPRRLVARLSNFRVLKSSGRNELDGKELLSIIAFKCVCSAAGGCCSIGDVGKLKRKSLKSKKRNSAERGESGDFWSS